MRILSKLTSVAIIAIALSSCKKEATSTQAGIYLTDAPADYAKVNIDLKEVKIRYSDDGKKEEADKDKKWVSLQTNQGIYNLLDLQNGVNKLIATGIVPTNDIREIRLILGINNSIEVNGKTLSLIVPSGAESGLKIKINKDENISIQNLVIDFDAALSIRKESNDTYMLRPVIKIKK